MNAVPSVRLVLHLTTFMQITSNLTLRVAKQRYQMARYSAHDVISLREA